MVPVHHKDDYRPCGEITIFTDDNFPSEKCNLWVASWDWTALHMDSCDSVHLWPTLCKCVQNWPSTKRISITLLVPWNHNLLQLGGLGGISMGGPIARWTKDYNGFCDVSCGPLQRFAWLGAVSRNGTCSRPSDVAGRSFRENDFKIDSLFYTTNIGVTDACTVTFTSYCKKRLGIWTWI